MQRQFAALTGVRGAAATWVVIFHAYPVLAFLFHLPERSQVPVARDGFMAVDLFFVLSGFVLCLAYHDRFVADFRLGLGEFLFSRICRIVPLHWICLAVFVLLVLSFPRHWWGPGPFTLEALVACVLLIQNWISRTALAWNHPSWSLSAEWLAYLMFPFLMSAIRRTRDYRLAVAASVASLIVLDVFLWSIHSATLNLVGKTGLVRCMCEFSAGALAWKALLADQQRPRLLGEASALFGIAILALVVVAPELQLLAPFGFVALIVGCALPSRATSWLFANRVVRFLGDISFSIYLTHIIILGCIDDVIQQFDIVDSDLSVRLAVTFAYPVLLLTVAYLTWRFIEQPSQAVGRTHARRVTTAALLWIDSWSSRAHQRGLAAASLAFWIMTIVATTLGTTAGHALLMTLHVGYAGSTIILMIVFVGTLIPQGTAHRYNTSVQWSVVLSMCAVGATLWDFVDRSAGFRYVDGSLLLVGASLVMLVVWRWILGAAFAGQRASRGVDIFYWFAILLAIALGTTEPNFLTETCGVGVIGTAIAISVALAGVTVTSYYIRLPGTTLFWLAFLLLRPLGVTLGDALTKPHIQMGLQLGSAAASVGLAIVLSFIVMFGEDRRARVTFQPQTKPGSAS